MRCAKKSDLKCDVCSVTDRLFFAIFVRAAFFAIFANVAFFCDVCSDRFFFRDVRSSRFFLRLLFESLFFFAIFVHVSCKIIVQIAFFLRFSSGSLFLAIFAHVPFFADAFQTHFSRISFEKFGNVNLPTHFCKSQIAFLNIIFFIAQLQKSDFAGHRFFLAIFVPIAFLRLFFGGRNVSNAILLHFFRCGHASIAFSQVLE